MSSCGRSQHQSRIASGLRSGLKSSMPQYGVSPGLLPAISWPYPALTTPSRCGKKVLVVMAMRSCLTLLLLLLLKGKHSEVGLRKS